MEDVNRTAFSSWTVLFKFYLHADTAERRKEEGRGEISQVCEIGGSRDRKEGVRGMEGAIFVDDATTTD